MANKTPKQASVMPITEFMKGCRTTGTGYSYRSGVLLFLDVVYGHKRKGSRSTDAEFAEYEALAVRYLKERRDNAADVVAFIQHMNTAKTPSKTIKVKVQGVREFLKKNRIALDDFDKDAIKKVLPRRVKRETNYDFMNVDKIQAILPHLDIRMQALTLCLIASGARIGELLNVNMADLDMDNTPISLFLRDTKGGDNRKVYLTQEAGAALKRWFTVRSKYLVVAGERSSALKIHKDVSQDTRIFPFERTSVYRHWDRALVKSGLFRKDPRTDRNTLSIHRLRAFFRQTISPKVGIDVAEQLLGHRDAYDDTYRETPEPELAALYHSAEECLTVSNTERIKRDIKTQAKVLEQQNSELEALRTDRDRLRERLNEVERVQATLEATKARAHADPMYATLEAKLDQMSREIAELKKK